MTYSFVQYCIFGNTDAFNNKMGVISVMRLAQRLFNSSNRSVSKFWTGRNVSGWYFWRLNSTEQPHAWAIFQNVHAAVWSTLWAVMVWGVTTVVLWEQLQGWKESSTGRVLLTTSSRNFREEQHFIGSQNYQPWARPTPTTILQSLRQPSFEGNWRACIKRKWPTIPRLGANARHRWTVMPYIRFAGAWRWACWRNRPTSGRPTNPLQTPQTQANHCSAGGRMLFRELMILCLAIICDHKVYVTTTACDNLRVLETQARHRQVDNENEWSNIWLWKPKTYVEFITWAIASSSLFPSCQSKLNSCCKIPRPTYFRLVSLILEPHMLNALTTSSLACLF